jgi:UDPglucose 6-dehydrogenase
VKALVATARNNGLDFTLLAAVDAVNDRQKRLLAQKAKTHFAGEGGVRGRKIAVWGLAFKPKTDDVRCAPAFAIVDELLADGAEIAVHDPVAMEVAKKHFDDRVRYATNPYDAVQGAEALLLVTEWNEFRQPDFQRVKELMAKPVIFDGRNIWNAQRLRGMGFSYYGVGRAAKT